MSHRFRMDGTEYDADALSAEGKALLEHLQFTQLQIQMLTNQQALLTKAKNAYIAELKSEIVHRRTGIDLGDLFGDD